MDVFFLVLAVAFGIFGLLAAVIALRQRRHPGAGCAGEKTCGCHGGKIRYLQQPPKDDGENDGI